MRTWSTTVALIAAQCSAVCARRQTAPTIFDGNDVGDHDVTVGQENYPRLDGTCDGSDSPELPVSISENMVSNGENIVAIGVNKAAKAAATRLNKASDAVYKKVVVACQSLRVPVFKDAKFDSVTFKSVTPRCYKTDPGLVVSWDDVTRNETTLPEYLVTIDDTSAGKGEKGVCKLPRGSPCVKDTQCRPGTLCGAWNRLMSAKHKFYCGLLTDMAKPTRATSDLLISTLEVQVSNANKAKVEKLNDWERVKAQLKDDNILPVTLQAKVAVSETLNDDNEYEVVGLPAIGKRCDGTSWVKTREMFAERVQVCRTVKIPVLQSKDKNEVVFKDVHPRCFKSNVEGPTAFSLQPLVQGDDERYGDDVNDEQFEDGYARGDYYAGSGETGVCAIPRSKPCMDDKQCRPGTSCILWKGSDAPKEYRCGTFQDMGSKKAETILKGIAMINEKLEGQSALITLVTSHEVPDVSIIPLDGTKHEDDPGVDVS